MMEELTTCGGALYQVDAVQGIISNFGEAFTYLNSSGSVAISRAVLLEFRKISGDTVVWDRSEVAWRLRHDGEAVGSRQTD